MDRSNNYKYLIIKWLIKLMHMVGCSCLRNWEHRRWLWRYWVLTFILAFFLEFMRLMTSIQKSDVLHLACTLYVTTTNQQQPPTTTTNHNHQPPTNHQPLEGRKVERRDEGREEEKREGRDSNRVKMELVWISLSRAGAKLQSTIMLSPMCHHSMWLKEERRRGREEPTGATVNRQYFAWKLWAQHTSKIITPRYKIENVYIAH